MAFDPDAFLGKAAPTLDGKTKVSGGAPGLVEAGNIDLTNRPKVKNADGSVSTVRSMSFGEGGREILVPTVTDDGRILSDDEAIALYHKTGKHLGKFKAPADATSYAKRLHDQQASTLPKGGFDPDAFLAEPKPQATPPQSALPPDRVARGGLTGVITGKGGGTERSVSEAAARGALQGASYGWGDEISAGVDTAISHIPGVRFLAQKVNELGGSGPGLPVDNPSITYAERRDAYRQRNTEAKDSHPRVYLGGEIAGSMATPLTPFKGAGIAKAAGNAGVQGALASAGNSEADTVGGVLQDAAIGGGTGAVVGAGVSKLVRSAPERIKSRILSNISRGEAGGAAKDKLYRKVVAAAGEEGDELAEVLDRHPKLKRTFATTAASNPAKAEKLATKTLDGIDGELTPLYKKIDAGPAVPDVDDVHRSLNLLRAELKDAGNTGMADVVEKFQGHLEKHYAPGTKIKAEQIRKLKGEIGEAAGMSGEQAVTPFAKRAKQLIYGAMNETIESAASRTPGVSVDRLRQLNGDMSMFITVRDALADRAAKAASGRTNLYEVVAAGASAAAGGAAGGLDGMLLASGANAARKAALPVARATDYQLSKLVLAARAGSTPAQLGQLAIELGVSRAIAQEIGRRGISALETPQDMSGPKALLAIKAAATKGPVPPALIQQAIESGVPEDAITSAIGTARDDLPTY